MLRTKTRYARVWATTLAWIEPFYDAEHLRATVRWLVRLEPAASEPLLIAALTHDMERHFPGGTQPDKAAGAWDDLEYNTRHQQRSARIVSEWLRVQYLHAPHAHDHEQPLIQLQRPNA